MKRLLLVFSVVFISTMMWAGQISRDQALRQAQQFMNQKGMSMALSSAETPLSKARARGQQMADYYYVFNAGQNHGFVIVSGDDRTPAILGYADKGTFNVESIPENMAAWLEGYAGQIKYIQEHNIQRAAPQKVNRNAVAPFVTAHWDQRSPFNDACTVTTSAGSIVAVTGCVATAMAQVMYYYRYPAQTSGDIPAYIVNYTGVGGHTFESVPAGTAIDWANMIDRYTDGAGTETQRSAVANLMLYAGKSVKMKYSNISSSAKVADVADALKNYFGYGPTTAYKQKWAYGATEWDNLIYNEIRASRPVIYGGQAPSGAGHAFVLDGCDANGYYHVNWGWGDLPTSPDGYFLLSAMTPAVEGTGGADGGYNDVQEAVVGIQVGGSLNETPRLATTKLEFNGGTSDRTISRSASISVEFQLTSHMVNTYDMESQMGLYKDGTFQREIGRTYSIASFDPNAYLTSAISYDVSLGSSLPVGKYQIIPVSRQSGSSTWQKNDRSDEFFITAIVNQNEVKLVFGDTNEEPQAPEVSDAERAELKAQVDLLTDVVSAMNVTIRKNADDLKDLKAKIASAQSDLDKIDQQIADIEKKLDDDLLSEATKKSFMTTLNLVKDSRKNYYDALYALKQTCSAIETAHTQQANRLSSIIEIINTVNQQVTSVDTKAAYNNLVNQVMYAKEALDNLTPSSVEADINAEYAALAKLPTASNMTDALTQLGEQVDKAIEEAKKAKEEEDKKKQEEQRDSLKAEVTKSADAFMVRLDAIIAKMNESKKSVLALKDMLPTIDEAIQNLEEQAAALKAILEEGSTQAARTRSEGLTDEQRATYQAVLDDIVNKQIPDLKAQRDALAAEIAKTEKAISDQETVIAALREQIDDVKKTVGEATTLEAVKAQEAILKTALENATKLEAEIPQTTGDITVLQHDIVELSAALNNAVKNAQEVVAEANKAVKANEEEQRDSLKAEVMKSADSLVVRLDTINAKLDEAKKSVLEMKDMLSTIDETILKLEEQAAALKAILEKGSTQTGRTRSEGLTDEQRATYQAVLDDIVNKQIPDLKAQRDALAAEIAKTEKAISDQETVIAALGEQVADVKKAVGEATTLEAVETQETALDSIKAAIDQLDTAIPQIANDIVNQQLVTLSLLAAGTNAVKAAQETVTEAQNTWTGISGVSMDESEIEGRYDLRGNRVDGSYKGMVIVKMKDGQTRKIMKR